MAGRPADAANGDRLPGRILVADDNAALLGTLRRMLEREGHEVHTVEDGAAALDAVAAVDPDLILLDVVMPELTGLEVCRRLKAAPETRLIPVVVITGLDDSAARLDGIEAGADDFLSKPFDRVELLARVRSLLRMKHYTDELDRAEGVLITLGLTIEERDPYTQGHCERLASIGAELGRRLGLSAGKIRDLERGGYLHDIGKIAVPDAVLKKPGRLTAAERALIRRHPAAGERICGPLRSLASVLPIIRHHHERADGSGYPDGLVGEEIPLTARILQIVDVFDALTTDRPYRAALGVEEAVRIMAEEVDRGWWDPDIFRSFRTMVEQENLERDGAGR